jgi:putative nucleotidyltransferase with HDIG domain
MNGNYMSAVLDYKRKVYSIRDLPTLPVIAQKVLTLADDDETSAEKLTAMISSDQSLSVKVLGLANSAYYGYRAKIGTIRHAVIVIGTNMLKQLSLSVLVCGTIGKGGKDRAEFWKHSFGTASASSMIARRTGISDGDLSFMAGLIHDVGKMIIDTYFPEEHGMQHTEVGGWMGERWQLPQHLINAITHHHSLEPEHLAQPIVACVHAADACAKLALTTTAVTIAPEVLEALKLTDQDFLELVEELKGRAGQIDKFLM